MGFGLAMCQILVEGGRPRANLDRAAAALERAAQLECRLAVLPECLDVGWTHPSGGPLAEPIPGPHTDFLAQIARRLGLYVAAGLVERDGDRRYNAAVLIGPDGKLLLHHRKINELEIGLGIYSIGDRLAVARTDLGVIGLNICADNFESSLSIGHVLGRMGARLLVSPCSWVVEKDRPGDGESYSPFWEKPYGELSRLYGMTVVGVSHVGQIEAGPWAGREAIGCSLAVGPDGEASRVLARGTYGAQAQEVVRVEVDPRPPLAQGTGWEAQLARRGYRVL